jgi:hypothetical protein
VYNAYNKRGEEREDEGNVSGCRTRVRDEGKSTTRARARARAGGSEDCEGEGWR